MTPSTLKSEERQPANSSQGPLRLILVSMTAGLVAPLITVKGQLSLFVVGPNPPGPLVKLDIWIVMIGVQAFVWTIVAAWLLPYAWQLVRLNPKRVIWRCLLCTVILLTPLLISAICEHGAGIPPKMIAGVPILIYFGVLGTVFDTLVVFVLFLGYEAAITDFEADHAPLARAIEFSQRLSLVQQFFIAASLVLGLGVVGTAAQQSAIRADRGIVFPKEYVVLFGLVGSLTLLAGYAPIRLALYRKSKQLIDEASGPVPSQTNDLKPWLETRASLEALMGNNLASIFGLGGALPLMLPFVLGSVAKLIAS